MASKYKLDWRIRFIDWLMKRTTVWSEENLPAIRASESDFISRGFRKRIELYKIEDKDIEGRHGAIPIRIYYPSAKQGLALIVFYHGGGFTIGNIGSHDHICRTIARDSEVLVVSVAYRLAPEHKYPIPVEDCYDALLWAADNAETLGADGSKLFVMGDSAGGNLSAVCALLARDNKGPHIAGQVLIYPAVDTVTLDRPSRVDFEDAPILPKESMDFFISMYTDSEDTWGEATLSPYWADSHENLPPALIQVAEYDPLRDEGLAYAEKLRAAGVSAKDICYPRMVHGFFSIGAFTKETKRAYGDIKAFIAEYV